MLPVRHIVLALATLVFMPMQAMAAAENPAETAVVVGTQSTPAAISPKYAPLPDPTLVAKIDLSSQHMVVLVNGEPTYSWPISSGAAGHATPTGSFQPQWTARMWYSRQYGRAPMPHAVFIHNGVAVHATGAVGRLGTPASHGCIRLSPANARTFYNLVQKHGLKMTRVSVFGKPTFRGGPAMARVSRAKKRDVAKNDSFWSGFGYSSAEAPGFASKKGKSAENGSRKRRSRSAQKAYSYGYN